MKGLRRQSRPSNNSSPAQEVFSDRRRGGGHPAPCCGVACDLRASAFAPVPEPIYQVILRPGSATTRRPIGTRCQGSAGPIPARPRGLQRERVDAANGPRITCCCRRSLRATRVPTGGRATLADNAEMSRPFAAIPVACDQVREAAAARLTCASVAFTLAPGCPGPAARPMADGQNSQTRPARTA
jgi:hypothetical protein